MLTNFFLKHNKHLSSFVIISLQLFFLIVSCGLVFPQAGSIEGFVYNDLNGNGTKDGSSDPGLFGWTVRLFLTDDSVFVAGYTTLSDGEYVFSNLSAGNYIVSEVNQTGWIQTQPAGNIYNIPLNGQSVSGQNFGNLATATLGSISGKKFHDLNDNHAKDNGEPGIPNWTIYLTGNRTNSRVTNASGEYVFNNLPPGDYTVSEESRADWDQTFPLAGFYSLTLTGLTGGKDFVDQDFGNYLSRGSISGVKFFDLNDNGVLDGFTYGDTTFGEPGISGWTIYLTPTNPSGTTVSTTTGAFGSYTFPDLADGDYRITEELPTGWVQTCPPVGYYDATIGPGTRTIVKKDFGNCGTGSISGQSFEADNADCQSQGVLQGSTIQLQLQAPPLQTNLPAVTTGSDGSYSFNNLPAGSYIVSESPPPNWEQAQNCPPGGSYPVNLSNGGHEINKDFGNRRILSTISGEVVLIFPGFVTDNGGGIFAGVALDGWTVNLEKDGNPSYSSTTTNSQGLYSFTHLPTGTYDVSLTPQTGYEQFDPTSPAYYERVITVDNTVLGGLNFAVNGTGTISGTKHNTANGGGVVPNWEMKLVMASPAVGEMYTYTDGNGDYQFTDLPPGTYTLSEISNPLWTQVSPSSPGTWPVTLIAGIPVTGKDFGNTPPTNPVQDLSTSVAGGVARPGFHKEYAIGYGNQGTVPVSAPVVVTFVYPEHTTFNTTSQAYTTHDLVTRTLTWTLGTLNPCEGGTILVDVTIDPAVPLHTHLTSHAYIDPIQNDDIPSNNDATETEEVRGAFDPNEKLVTPVGIGPFGLIDKDITLTYQINFQNTGTDTAFNIVVRDTLDGHLDLTTFTSGASNHSYFLSNSGDGKIAWIFQHVDLPDSHVNEMASHGFVKFSIKPRSDVAAGQDIVNRAGIYFDFNPVVMTNTVANRIAGPSSDSIAVCRRWNMVSLPENVDDSRVTTIFSGAISSAFTYEHPYVQKDTLIHGKGYWLKFAAAHEVHLTGSMLLSDSIDVVAGWNMIGSVINPVPTSTIVTSPDSIIKSQFFGYQSRYVVTDTIQPGKGYWIKVKEDGKLVLSSGESRRIAKPSNPEQLLKEFNSLAIVDANGNEQQLYFGRKPSEHFSLELYEMPPAFQGEAFDARFASNHTLEVVDSGMTQEFPITVSSAGYPITITWELKSQSATSSLIIDGKKTPLNVNGSARIAQPASNIALRLIGLADIPKDITLEQSYPNPFNPSTTIRYELPKATHVMLIVYSILGQEIEKLVNEEQPAGFYQVKFDASKLSSGIYFYRLVAGTFSETKKLLLLR